MIPGRHVLRAAVVGGVIGAGCVGAAPLVLSALVIVVTAYVCTRLLRRGEAEPYDWPAWVYRVRLARWARRAKPPAAPGPHASMRERPKAEPPDGGDAW